MSFRYSGWICCRLFSFSGKIDWMAFTWKMDQASEDLEEEVGPMKPEDAGSAEDIDTVDEGFDCQKRGATEAIFWIRGNEPFGIFTNSSNPLTCAFVSYI